LGRASFAAEFCLKNWAVVSFDISGLTHEMTCAFFVGTSDKIMLEVGQDRRRLDQHVR
jgi:hypothetical protein